MRENVLLSWSSGKDSAWTLYELTKSDEYAVSALLTTYNQHFNRVAIHGVRLELLEIQAERLSIPLETVPLPWPCNNEIYEQTILNSLNKCKLKYSTTTIAHGDLFLEDVRNYRIELLKATDWKPIFPIWNLSTSELARSMIQSGFKAYITCVDPKQLPSSFIGREFNMDFLNVLPDSIDPCGENGEFHTFVYDAPIFKSAINIQKGEIVERDGFVFCDLLPKD